MKHASCALILATLVGHVLAQTVNDKGMITMTAPTQGVTVADSAALVPTMGMTVEAWFYLNPFPPGSPTIARKGNQASWLLRVDNNGTILRAQFTISNNEGVLVSASVPSVVSAWHHGAATFDGTTARLYLDGVLVASTAYAGMVTYKVGPLLIGAGTVATEQWIGSLDEIRLWSVARTQAEIAATRFVELPPTPGLVGNWRFNGNYLDSIGVLHGTPVGAIQNIVSTSPVVGPHLLAPPVAGLGAPILYEIYSTAPTGLLYFFDVSLTGTSPGVILPPPLAPVTIPLNPPWINTDFGSLVPIGTFTNFIGAIPPSHHVFPVVVLPPDPALTGSTISSAFVVADPALPSFITYVSPPKNTLIGTFGPDIVAVTPATSPLGGGGAMTITGNHFQQAATVQVGGVAATLVSVTATSIIAIIPPGALGPADVRVTNPDTLTDVLPGGITYVP